MASFKSLQHSTTTTSAKLTVQPLVPVQHVNVTTWTYMATEITMALANKSAVLLLLAPAKPLMPGVGLEQAVMINENIIYNNIETNFLQESALTSRSHN